MRAPDTSIRERLAQLRQQLADVWASEPLDLDATDQIVAELRALLQQIDERKEG